MLETTLQKSLTRSADHCDSGAPLEIELLPAAPWAILGSALWKRKMKPKSMMNVRKRTRRTSYKSAGKDGKVQVSLLHQVGPPKIARYWWSLPAFQKIVADSKSSPAPE